MLHEREVDVVFIDIQMPGLTGLELAQVLARFRTRPRSCSSPRTRQHAVEAFDLNAVDYVLKPVREERLAEAVRRVIESTGRRHPPPTRSRSRSSAAASPASCPAADIRYVEAQGDYARLHTATDSHLLRSPMSALEEQWADAGFVRIHRSLLVSLGHVDEVRVEGSRCSVVVGDTVLQVSRRHTPKLREVLTRRSAGVSERPPERVRVTGPPRSPHLPARTGRGASQIDDATRLGEIYLSSLLREQLRLDSGAGPFARARPRHPAAAVLAQARPAERRLLGLPLPWLVLGFAVYPFLSLVGWRYVRAAERNEEDFAELVETGDRP